MLRAASGEAGAEVGEAVIAPCRCTGCYKVRIFEAWQSGMLWRLHWPELADNAMACGHAETWRLRASARSSQGRRDPPSRCASCLLRHRARVLLAGGDGSLDAAEARRAHVIAVAYGDEEAIALWSRVIWRGLAGDGRYAWLREPTGGREKPRDWSVAPAEHPPPRATVERPEGPGQRFCMICKAWADHDGRSHGGRGKNAWRPSRRRAAKAPHAPA